MVETYIVEIPTIKLLKTICRLNKHTMRYIELPIIDLSMSVIFSMKRFDGEELKFICKVIGTLDTPTK